jgi:GNAT superfamily N-acetyltransferase
MNAVVIIIYCLCLGAFVAILSGLSGLGNKLEHHQIKIRKIKLKNLEEFSQNALNDPAFQNIAPISLVRAGSQAKNPLAEPDDITLLVALCNGRCVGYHGLLPGILKVDENYSKVYWGSTIYLDTGFRGQGHGKHLIREIQNTAVDLVLTDISASAEGIYRNMGFKALGDLPYYQLRLDRLQFMHTPFQYGGNQPEQPNVFGLIFNRFGRWSYQLKKQLVYGIVFQKLKAKKNIFKSKIVNRLDEELTSLMAQQSPSASFHRDLDTVNWMLQNPWVVSRKDAAKDVQNYYFSRVRDLFKLVALEIFVPDGNTRKGFLILSRSHKKNKSVVKILDYYFYDPQDAFIAGYFGIKYTKDLLADRIEYPESLNSVFEEQPFFKRLIKRKKRLYLSYPNSNDSPLAVSAGKIKLDYCDGDTAFT